MPSVVVDTSISLPATLSPGGMMRRFWVVLALGALTYEIDHRQLELDELSRRAEREGGVIGGLNVGRERVEEARSRQAALLELLPHGTPDSWVAIGSAPLFDEYERKLREIGQKLDPALRDKDIPLLRRQLEAVCAIGAPPFTEEAVPLLTQDRNDDGILYTALLGDADLLVSDDKHLVPDRHEHHWEYDGRSVVAVTVDTLLSERLDAATLSDIDGSLLASCASPRVSYGL
jgi:predicted nucleic acid-binding protein